MSYTPEPGEIIYANLTASTIARSRVKAKTITAQKVVFGTPYTGFNPNLSWSNRDDKLLIQKFGVEEDLVLVKVELICRCGFKNKSLGCHTGVANEEARNKITGAYE